MRKVTTAVLLLVVVLMIGIGGRYLILGRAAPVSLKSGTITAAVEQAQQNRASFSYVPIEGKDYSISFTRYFDNDQWAVATLTGLNASSDPALVVLHENAGNWQPILGPDNSFRGANLNSLPSDVAKYINP